MNNDNKITGIPILDSFPGSPSEAAGLKRGDVIVAVNGVAVQGWQDYVDVFEKKTGNLILDILRDNHFFQVTIVLPAKESTELEKNFEN